MTNIWTQTFEEVRKPFFQIEDPYIALEEKRTYDPSRDQDGDGDNDFADNMVARMVASGKVSKDQAIKKTRNKKYNKESVELSEVIDKTKESQEKKLDVKNNINNKITVNPQIREELEQWVDELIEEGYDFSDFTWDEIVEIYESVILDEGTAGMPARGDAENVDATDQKMLSAKRRMAQAQIRADLARVQYQKASVANESVVNEYLSQRVNVFENLHEGLLDFSNKKNYKNK